jgi:hypothetical protein
MILAAVLAGAALLPACAKKSDKDAKPAASASAEPKKAGDGSLSEQIQKLAKVCEVAVPASGLKCKEGEQRKLVSDFARQKSRVPALQALTQSLGDSDPKVQTVAANLLHLGFRSSLGVDAKAGDVPADVAKDLIAAVGKLPKPQASQAVPAAVHAAMLSGQQDALFKMLEAKASDKLGSVAYRYLMTHGRMTAFERIKALVAGPELDAALSAAAAPNAMRNWTAEEEGPICSWAAELLGDTRVGIATRASSLLGHCSGQYIDTLLSKGEELLKAGKLSQAQIAPFRDVCSLARRRVDKDGAAPKVSEQQCTRNRNFLEKALASKDVDGKTKAMVLSALAYQWPDDTTKKLLKKYENDSDKELAKRAQDTIKRLERRDMPPGKGGPGLMGKGPGAAGSASPVSAPAPAPAPAASGSQP